MLFKSGYLKTIFKKKNQFKSHKICHKLKRNGFWVLRALTPLGGYPKDKVLGAYEPYLMTP